MVTPTPPITSTIVDLRPLRSASSPKIAAPAGRITTVTANEPNTAAMPRVGLLLGKMVLLIGPAT
ncbi:Uncharacterised protein [Amycolatopsis camponoti]|uniref:Uncharacterized protein n=1 Tax=Amycolatopsis camponoti TaxID=2606593 RepID=A0A6I8M1Z6_9PSEU|nr:Uncharacterised protein [Amycolatopsis camponoti]